MSITKEELEKLRETIQEGMNTFCPNKNGSDYRCAYCYNTDDMDHAVDCGGKESLAILEKLSG